MNQTKLFYLSLFKNKKKIK